MLRRSRTTGKHRTGCSKWLFSEAAGESKPEAYPWGYVGDFDEPRTKLAAIFSILLKEPLSTEEVRPRRPRAGDSQTDAPFTGVVEVLLIEQIDNVEAQQQLLIVPG
jgi:hypothetical protein